MRTFTPAQLDRFFMVWNGHKPEHEVSAPLEYLCAHFPMYKLNAALDWLVNNRITGKRFVEFYKYDCGGSNLHFHKVLLSKIEKASGLRPVIYGKDFQV